MDLSLRDYLKGYAPAWGWIASCRPDLASWFPRVSLELTRSEVAFKTGSCCEFFVTTVVKGSSYEVSSFGRKQPRKTTSPEMSNE